MPIDTITLNQEYPPFKKYLATRSQNLANLEAPWEQYAVGVGVSLLLIQKRLDHLTRRGQMPPSDDSIAEAQRAVARGVLAVMPKFDELAREAGLVAN